jgi:hypothetical protein
MKPWTMAVVLLIAGITAACETIPEQFHRELQPYVGRNITELAQVLGYPESKREMLGDTLYTWSVNRHATMTLPTYTTTTGDVGGTPFTATTQGTEDVPMHFVCTLTIATDSAGVIKNYSWNGNGGGCKQIANRLDR